jgi:hypothetical protein
MNIEGVQKRLRREVRRAGSARQFAEDHDICESYIWAVLGGATTPGPLILGSLGLEKVISYRSTQ